jgi:hypothetical protein
MCEFHVVDILELCYTKNFKNFSVKVACKNELIDLNNIKFPKNHHINDVTFQTHPNKPHSRTVNTLFITNFRKNFEFQNL